MSNDTKEETLPKIPADTQGTPAPARKRVAKKAAAKKTAVKKVAAKKVAAKKAARKSPAKASLAPDPPVIQAPVPIAQAKKTAGRVKKSAEMPASAAEPAPSEPSYQEPALREEQRRFGRVPGGGPVASRETPPPAPRPPIEAPAPAEPAPPPVPPARIPPPQPGQQPQPSQARNFQNRDGQNRDGQNRDGQPRESRSKRRREKRKNRNERQPQGEQRQPQGEQRQPQGEQRQPHPKHPDQTRGESGDFQGGGPNERRSAQVTGPKIAADGMLELAPKGFGFLRLPGKNFEQARDDVFVTPESIRKYNLRLGQWIHGFYQEGPRGPQLVEITSVNGMTPAEAAKLPHFDELKAINPTRRISFETTPERFTTRVVDIMAPVGRGQRGLIVSPPRSGKTTILLHMAEAIREKYDEAIHLMVLLVDERPEEVTEFRRALPGAEIYASSNDELPRNHCRIAELAIERAKRLVEAGQDVFLLMDSITRLARAYNNTMNNRGRGTGSGGITIGALEVPRRLFAAARNTRGGGSLTILATALIQTNSRADEAIFMEFKGTGNMELVLDRKIAENYIYPAVDIFKSGTRREELLIPDHMLHKIHLIRRGLSGHRPVEAMERLLFFLKKFPNNPQMLLEIKG